ncbi:GIY-YIG nuclease family protein [Prevotella sp.]|uniref:GIY-YIG nuclease family protein n=1 Tax=Prevotella sp. TaxID=59823 RepID=UPI002F925A4C
MGKTVTTYLIDGDPKGTQYVFISNKICQMYVIPRSNLSILNERHELQTPALYILLGEDETTKPKAYIGETENFRERVRDHDSNKTFWQKALLFISKDAAMTKADVQYLEHRAIAEAKAANSFVLNENKQTPKAPNLPEYRKDDMDEFFEDVKFLCSFVGYNIFDIIKPKEEHLFFTKGRGCDAKGFYDSKGFTLLKGSTVVATSVPSFSWKEKRERMLKEYTHLTNEKLRLNTDITFSSPSTAADFCIGSSNNGWITWKDKDGNTLDSIYRKPLE